MCSSQFICAVWMRYCIRNKYLVDQNGAISIWVGNIKVVGGFHLELVHGLAGLGDIQLVGILAGHSCFLLSICGALFAAPGWVSQT